ncbi:MAG: hypothetical protein FD159_1746 [Syntrophaceae bacterium]|nr:MAG: hypothetical protein FD159_1746 [Syntrophaceae bacterium]
MSNICYRDTIGDMARRAATKYGDKTAIIFRDLKLSFYDLERQARRFANLMTSYGVQQGDRVAVYAYNSHYYPISMRGIALPVSGHRRGGCNRPARPQMDRNRGGRRCSEEGCSAWRERNYHPLQGKTGWI